LPIPNEFIKQIHRLASTVDKNKGITTLTGRKCTPKSSGHWWWHPKPNYSRYWR